ncbi:MAG: hypothetical protein E7268_01130 [Lachnospiraceae bacterium]|nr:hypothetical protein [Lachnospiraceae bacterium]
MEDIAFSDLAGYLKQRREIEFVYNGRRYSITNYEGFWNLCDDTEHILLNQICRFDETEILVSKIAEITIDGMKISQIFDKKLYDTEGLYVL